MWSVKPPTLTAAQSATACAQGVGNKEVRDRVKAAVPDIAANSALLQSDIYAQNLHAAAPSRFHVAGLTDTELKGLYKGQLARQGSKARHIYDHVMGNALHGLCSYCQYGQATSLDHFVPITVVPGLAIDPWNLVPACDRCNKLLRDTFSASPAGQLLHPYARPPVLEAQARWLYARVVASPEPVVAFHADPVASVTAPVRDRILAQFDQLELAKLFQVVSARELSGTRQHLTELFAGGPPEPVRAHLAEQAEDAFAAHRNDRRGAMYEALAADSWFVSGGYRV